MIPETWTVNSSANCQLGTITIWMVESPPRKEVTPKMAKAKKGAAKPAKKVGKVTKKK